MNWDEYFFRMAELAGEKSVCLAKKVGCVAVRDKMVIATGFNGPPRGVEHPTVCRRKELRDKGYDESTYGRLYDACPCNHAEQNLIANAARIGVSLKDSVLYCTYAPCYMCAKSVINAGIVEVRYKYPPVDATAIPMMEWVGIKCTKWEDTSDA